MYSFKTYLFLFFVYSIFGWVWETTYESIRNKEFLNRGMLTGFYIPLYGVGGAILTWALTPFQGEFNLKNVLITYVAGVVIATTVEYITGWLLETIVGVRFWDYTEYPLNIKGRICVIASLFWGVLAVVFIDIIVPTLVMWETKIPHDTELIFLSSITTIFILDLGITINTLFSLKEKIKEITEEISVKELAENVIENAQDKIGTARANAQEAIGNAKASASAALDTAKASAQEVLDTAKANAHGAIDTAKANANAVIEKQRMRIYESNDPFMRRMVHSFPKAKFQSEKAQHAFNHMRQAVMDRYKKR